MFNHFIHQVRRGLGRVGRKRPRLVAGSLALAGMLLLAGSLALAGIGEVKTRVTSGSTGRDSYDPSLSGDGAKVAFRSDADFLSQGIPDDQNEIWLYDTATMTLTRITTSGAERNSRWPSLNGDGTKVAFASDADFLGQGIPQSLDEIWLFGPASPVYLPLILKNRS